MVVSSHASVARKAAEGRGPGKRPFFAQLVDVNVSVSAFPAESWVYRANDLTIGIHGHRTVKAPHPVRSAQLNTVPPS